MYFTRCPSCRCLIWVESTQKSQREDEAAALVEVDPAVGLRAVGVDEDDAAFEDVGVVIIFRHGRSRARDIEQLAELAEEELVIGAFGAAGFGPAVDEGLDGVVSHAECEDGRGLAQAGRGKARERA